MKKMVHGSWRPPPPPLYPPSPSPPKKKPSLVYYQLHQLNLNINNVTIMQTKTQAGRRIDSLPQGEKNCYTKIARKTPALWKSTFGQPGEAKIQKIIRVKRTAKLSQDETVAYIRLYPLKFIHKIFSRFDERSRQLEKRSQNRSQVPNIP